MIGKDDWLTFGAALKFQDIFWDGHIQNLVPDWYVSNPHVWRLRRNSLVGRCTWCTFPKKESEKYNVLNSTTNHPLFFSKWMLCTSHSRWHWQPGWISHHQASSSSCSSPNNFPSESCHGFVGIKHGCPLFFVGLYQRLSSWGFLKPSIWKLKLNITMENMGGKSRFQALINIYLGHGFAMWPGGNHRWIHRTSIAPWYLGTSSPFGASFPVAAAAAARTSSSPSRR